MDIIANIKKGIKNPRKLATVILCDYLAPLFPDRIYIRLKSLLRCGYSFNLDTPTSFNEKLNWLKLHDRRTVYTTMVDKYRAKDYVGSIIGREYIVPLIGVWNKVDDIDFDSLPEKCMLKANFDSGGIVVFERGRTDIKMIKQKLTGSQSFNYYYRSREWPYRNVERKIIAEEFLDNDGQMIYDYKFWCFNGVPKIVYVTCKGKEIFENFYDQDFNILNIDHGFPRHLPEFTKPECFELMKSLAAQLSKGIPFVRCDFMPIKGKVYFGECTFYDWGGFRPFGGDWDTTIGDLLILPCNNS